MNKNIIVLSLGIAAFGISVESSATTGYFLHGYGVKSQGNAGVAIANFQDSFTIATNPAGLSWIGSRVDVGATLFSPDRHAEIKNNLYGADFQEGANSRRYFVLPEIGVAKQLDKGLSVGLSIYGNGGMNTNYKNNPYSAFGNQGRAGVDLTQIFVSPAISWRYTDKQSLGLGLNFLYQKFEAVGLSGFGALSTDGSHLSNQGKDSSTGLGVRVGWSALLTDQLTVGLTYSSKIKADKFDKYRGLFAENGSFDVPENYGLGASFAATPKLTIATDILRINYSDVTSVGNTFNFNKLATGALFGSQFGPGFGWKDINVYKLGINYQVNPNVILRAGYSYNDQPIQANQTFLNILAPGVIQNHLSVGGTWNIDKNQELSFSYTYGYKKKVKGHQSIPAEFGGGEANLQMQQNLLGISYAYLF